MTDVIERLRDALNDAMRPGTADSDVNVYALSVAVSRGDLEMAIAEIDRLRATITNLQHIAGKASIDGHAFAQNKKAIRDAGTTQSMAIAAVIGGL